MVDDTANPVWGVIDSFRLREFLEAHMVEHAGLSWDFSSSASHFMVEVGPDGGASS
jgi:hypothetical protein